MVASETSVTGNSRVPSRDLDHDTFLVTSAGRASVK